MRTGILTTLSLCLAVAGPAVLAERICPDGKSYDREQCKEVKRNRDGTVEVYPVGKSYDRDQVMEGREQSDGTMRFCPKGKSYDRDACWTVTR